LQGSGYLLRPVARNEINNKFDCNMLYAAGGVACRSASISKSANSAQEVLDFDDIIGETVFV